MFGEYLNAHDLHALLCPREGYRPFPRRQEREVWNGLESAKRDALIAWGEEAGEGYPMLTATQFMAFPRTGSRQAYEKPYFERRKKLMGAVLAECVCDDGRFMDAVIDGLWCICEETTWVISAHNGDDHPGMRPMTERLLPDAENPYVDLFAAQTAAVLADTLYLLEDKLDAVSLLLARRVRVQIEQRVLHPFETHDDFWWMGMIRRNVNNWTPWIVSNILDTVLLLERDERRRSALAERALRMLDSYLAVMPPDGGCDEGAGYFNVSGAALFDCLESVYLATRGRVSFYQDQHIRNIGAFPLKVHVDGAYFLNFADCDAKPMIDGERIYRFGVRTENAQLAALGAQLYRQSAGDSVKPADTPQMNRVLYALFADIAPQKREDGETFAQLPDLQVFVWRQKGLVLAAKGGHNAESHNHNDVGSFMVYLDGKPQIIDMGNWMYTALTFSEKRYTLDNTRAKNHNIPLIGDTEQCAGREYAACDVRADAHGASMNIAGAYPAQAGVRSLIRRFDMEADGVRLCDDALLGEPQRMTWVFMLRSKPEIERGKARFGGLVLEHDPALDVHVEEMPVTDARMARNFPGSIWRLTLAAQPSQSHRQTFTITRS